MPGIFLKTYRLFCFNLELPDALPCNICECKVNEHKHLPCSLKVNEGQIEVDQAALTGESLPVTMFTGDSAKMGSTVTRGEVEATVEVRVQLYLLVVPQIYMVGFLLH